MLGAAAGDGQRRSCDVTHRRHAPVPRSSLFTSAAHLSRLAGAADLSDFRHKTVWAPLGSSPVCLSRPRQPRNDRTASLTPGGITEQLGARDGAACRGCRSSRPCRRRILPEGRRACEEKRRLAKMCQAAWSGVDGGRRGEMLRLAGGSRGTSEPAEQRAPRAGVERCRKGESNQAYQPRCGEQRSSLPGWVSNHCRWRQSSWQSDCGSRRGSPGIG